MSTTADEVTSELVEAQEASSEIAASIEEVSLAVKHLLNAGLTKRALLLLVRDQITPPISLRDISAVINSLSNLDQYVNRPTD